MKRKKYVLFLLCESILLLCLSALGEQSQSPFLFSFPFAQIANGLKLLSQTSALGNGIALALLVSICSIPTVVYFTASNRNTTEAIILNLTSLVLFVAFYGMVNPLQFSPSLLAGIEEALPLFNGLFGVTIWSWIVACIVLHLLNLFRSGDPQHLRKYLVTAVLCLGALFTGYCFSVPASQLLANIRNPHNGMDLIFEILRFIAEIVPNLCNVLICISVADLLEAMETVDSDGVRTCAETLVKRCCISLGSAVILTAVLNALQIIFMKHLSNVHTNVDIPVVGIAFSLMILLIAGLLTENKTLRDDNDLFI